MIDRAAIPQDGPLTGRMFIALDDTAGIERMPTLYNGGIVCRITRPDGVVVTVDQRRIWPSFTHGCGVGVVPPGRYEALVMILKLPGDEFLFSNVGQYSVEFEFCELSGIEPVSGVIDVYACQDCGREEYRRNLDDREVIAPFTNEPLWAPGDVPDGPYREALHLVRAYTYGGGVIDRIWQGAFGRLGEREYYLDRVQDIVSNGRRYAAEIGVNVDYWELVAARYQDIRSGAAVSEFEAKSRHGGALLCR